MKSLKTRFCAAICHYLAVATYYAKLFLNDEFMELYLYVEQISDEFLDTRFDTKNGNLY